MFKSYKNNNYDYISNSFKFSFLKLLEEVKFKPEHNDIIEKEQVDVLIKYIDLSNNSLNREGISKKKKMKNTEK